MAYVTLCFPNYATAKGAAQALGFWDEDADRLRTDGQSQNPDGSWFGWSIDEIGLAVDTPAVVDPETGEVTSEATFKLGYYVNVTGELPPAIDQYMVPYGSGGRVFVGTSPEESP
jgi:hypothetical protein